MLRADLRRTHAIQINYCSISAHGLHFVMQVFVSSLLDMGGRISYAVTVKIP